MMKRIKDIELMDEATHNIRGGMAVLSYGIGAMIDFPSQVLMTALLEKWDKTERIYDERLAKLLNVSYFISPSKKGIPFVRFPEWYFCPKCRRFQPIKEWAKERKDNVDNDPYMLKRLYCPKDFQDLVPARIVTVCEHGHIDDFPWVNWVHRKNFGGEKKVCSNPKLLFKTGASAASGLEGVKIQCLTCQANASLKDAFGKNSFQKVGQSSKYHTIFSCSGKHPWKNEIEKCDLFPRAMQRGAASVYFPRIISSLVIPPYSSILNQKIEASSAFRSLMDIVEDGLEDINVENQIDFITDKIKKYSEKISNEICEKPEVIRPILDRKFLPSKKKLVTDKELHYKAEEYKALTGKLEKKYFTKDEFSRESVDISLYSIKGVKSIALIHKVKEVTTLIGFSRIQPTHGMDSSDGYFVSVKDKNTKFYPAILTRGEGIFIEFDKKKLSSFFNKDVFNNRIEELNRKYNSSFYGKNNSKKIDTEFVFLHTFSHLLIKELSFHCGYPIASIRERIYYGDSEDESMCGIFIYTTGGDAEGTLGGLVRQGYADCLPNIIKKAVEKAKFCANDPVCSFSDGQGIEALNYAACHACVLLPETCCEYSNILLDRTVVIGKMDGSIEGFFEKSLEK